MLEILGYVGSISLSVCAIPQLIKVLITKNVSSLSIYNLITWSFGCISMTIYVLFTTFDIPLLINYAINSGIAMSILVLYFRYNKR